jgi:starch synthase
VHQKGLDLVAEAANDIVENGGQMAILRLGDPEIEHMLSRTSRQHRDDIGVLIGFNEPMARRIVAASDWATQSSSRRTSRAMTEGRIACFRSG